MLAPISPDSFSTKSPIIFPEGMFPIIPVLRQDSSIRIMIVMANSLDCNMIHRTYSLSNHFQIVGATTILSEGINGCHQFSPHVLIVDPAVHVDAVTQTIEAVDIGIAQSAILLDQRVRDGLVATILSNPRISYLTREAGETQLLQATVTVGAGRSRCFDPAVSQRIIKTKRGMKLKAAEDRPSAASLTAREIQVLKLVSVGKSVRETASALGLAESTVDNHKSRLMHKLSIHKAAGLTCFAILDGLLQS